MKDLDPLCNHSHGSSLSFLAFTVTVIIVAVSISSFMLLLCPRTRQGGDSLSSTFKAIQFFLLFPIVLCCVGHHRRAFGGLFLSIFFSNLRLRGRRGRRGREGSEAVTRCRQTGVRARDKRQFIQTTFVFVERDTEALVVEGKSLNVLEGASVLLNGFSVLDSEPGVLNFLLVEQHAELLKRDENPRDQSVPGECGRRWCRHRGWWRPGVAVVHSLFLLVSFLCRRLPLLLLCCVFCLAPAAV